jgi:hypothetical protein
VGILRVVEGREEWGVVIRLWKNGVRFLGGSRIQGGLVGTKSTNHTCCHEVGTPFLPHPRPACELESVTMMCLGSARLRDTLISSPRVFRSLNEWFLSLPEEFPCGLDENESPPVFFQGGIVNRMFRFLVWTTADTVLLLTNWTKAIFI